MSYGIGIVTLKDDIEKKEIRYDFCDWTLGIAIRLHPVEVKDNLQRWYKEIISESSVTNMEKLLTAPCDIVAIIDKDGNCEFLKDRKPINGNGIDIKEYMNIKKQKDPLSDDFICSVDNHYKK